MITGDPAAVEAAARELRRAGRGLGNAGSDVVRHGVEVTAEWTGSAADAARDRTTLIGRRTQVGRDVCEDVATVLEHYAQELRAAQRDYAAGLAQREEAQAQEARLSGLEVSSRDPDRAALLREAARGAAAAQHALDAALARERVASEVAAGSIGRLTGELAEMSASAPASPQVPTMRPAGPAAGESWWSDNKLGGNDWVDLGNGVLMLPRNSSGHAAALQQRAVDLHGHFVERNRQLKGTRGPGVAAEKRYVRAMRDSSAIRAAEYGGARVQLESVRYPPPLEKALRFANRPLERFLPLPASAGVLRQMPIVNVVLAGWGTHSDMSSGMSAPHAMTKNAASTLAGTAAGAATATALGGVTLVGAPFVAGVAVGAAVGYGVGLAVKHWGDDVARGVSAAAGGVSDVAEDVWDAVTPW